MKYTWTNLITILIRLQNCNNLSNIDGLSLKKLRNDRILKCVQSEKCFLIVFQKDNEWVNIHSLLCDSEFHIPKDISNFDEIAYTLANGRIPRELKFIIDSLIKLGV